MKDPYAKTNTHIKNVNGMVWHGFIPLKKKIAVRFTSDEKGETISFSDEEGGLMIAVPFEKVAELIEETRNDKSRDSR